MAANVESVGTTSGTGKATRRRRRRREVVPVLLGLVWLFVAFYPVLFMLGASLRTQESFLGGSAWLPPLRPTFENYALVLSSGFWLYLLNSVVVVAASVLLIVASSLLTAYVIARVKGRLVQAVFNVFLLGLAIPLQASIIPIYILMIQLGIYDTLLALVFPFVAFGIPLTVLILVNFIRDIPRELYEAMVIEGASHWQVLRALVIPLSRPALVTVTIYNALQVWNGFLFPLILTQSPNVRVLPLALWTFRGEFTINIPAIMAAVFLSSLPIVFLYIVARRQLLSGLTAGFGK
ncbi:MAG: ABC transporter, permease protein 2 (cluster 1, maltose/g3p/polyamine/iron) [uncultured Rubrobacteraceae bacterium]|uniref:ABC transporter, permease protein 2 (Cluster 1, maltose/g3p/polyamine/iron) n=1 Tax=uncultured Rubrobacteraceae bacterium TaxID=349277 RepID=A0A6J4PE32_9ACTN|nr:MAG: ABC transporter, permease protein 2 (cluster 1, maltose/g3p/polyamine/iron) [uncultured Rubrobacteraceae bacterium]